MYASAVPASVNWFAEAMCRPMLTDGGSVPGIAAALASEIRRAWAEGNANTLQLANVVCRARKQLGRAWAEFWRTAKMPFSKRKADMLVGIARLDGLSEQTFAQLPRGWSILYHLSRLEHDKLENLVLDGFIRPNMTLAEAKRLVRRRGGPLKPGAKRPAVKAEVNKFTKFADSTLAEWSLRQLHYAGDKLRELLRRLDNHLASMNPNRAARFDGPTTNGHPPSSAFTNGSNSPVL
jgi:hypothetical protein